MSEHLYITPVYTPPKPRGPHLTPTRSIQHCPRQTVAPSLPDILFLTFACADGLAPSKLTTRSRCFGKQKDKTRTVKKHARNGADPSVPSTYRMQTLHPTAQRCEARIVQRTRSGTLKTKNKRKTKNMASFNAVSVSQRIGGLECTNTVL